jgi:hypothetical protein
MEQVVTFGADQYLVGTHCQPAPGPQAPVGFILLNAGVIARIGPRRFNVKLARQLAQTGFHSLRMDLSGQGDSRASSSNLPHEEQVRADLKAAMDWLQTNCGVTRFVVAGICSGAIAGLDVAQHDSRVVGLWMLDGYAYATLKSRLVRYWMQLTREFKITVKSWWTKAWAMLQGRETPRKRYSKSSQWRVPSREAFADTLDLLSGRGVQMFIMYSSDVLWQYSYQNQFKDTFKGRSFVNEVRCDHLKEADHTLTSLAAQQDVIGRIQAWAARFNQATTPSPSRGN